MCFETDINNDIKHDLTLLKFAKTVPKSKIVFQEFKYQCIKNKFSFQKLASRAIFLYLTNDKFRTDIHSTNDINLNKINGS